MSPSAANRVVVYHQGALGDFLLSLTVLQGLADADPSLRFHFRTRREHAGLIVNRSYYAGFSPGDAADLTPFFLGGGWKDASLPKDLAMADAALILGQSSSIPFAENLSQRLPVPVYWARSFPPEGCEEHVTRYIASQLEARGLILEDAVVRLEPTPEAMASVDALLAGSSMTQGEPILVVHMGSGGKKKIWPLSGWRMLLRRLAREWRGRVVTALGPADASLRTFADEMRDEVGLTVMDGLNLPCLAALLAAARAYLGNDSGVTHLAAAMGTPTVALFGPTRPETWAPLGENVHVIRLGWAAREDYNPLAEEHVPSSDIEEVLRRLRPLLA